jgi:hypothetical protein
MAATGVYVTVGLDKSGSIVEVRVNGRTIEPKEGKAGPTREGDEAPGCEEIAKRLVHELLVCRKKKPGQPPPPPVTDPCCIRDPMTGRIWCWC